MTSRILSQLPISPSAVEPEPVIDAPIDMAHSPISRWRPDMNGVSSCDPLPPCQKFVYFFRTGHSSVLTPAMISAPKSRLVRLVYTVFQTIITGN